MRLTNANVLLTGGSRGIGPHIARALVARGARVTLAARSESDLKEVANRLRGDRVAIAASDVTTPEGREAALDAAEDAFGPVDVLVNNAGVERVSRFADTTPSDIGGMIGLNLDATIRLSRLVLPGMLERRSGQIVNISSLAGKAAAPFNVVYSATKWGLVGFSYSLRAELRGSGVGVSVVCPGYVERDGMFSRHAVTDVRRVSGTLTTPEKVAAAVVKAIERNKAEVVVSGALPKLADVSFALSPDLSIATAYRVGGYEPFRREVEGSDATRA